ncbi:hypothetical protein WH47_12080 [Habropoda laboriosa]|uniref:Uncharacterized protein n=1 Tax=Habropoda laboriosa TaxID=597456 RepID=A0A0L7R1E8_9HYME|nr:hypothetical protein WH47_12080 [Habropoda laboriosa]
MIRYNFYEKKKFPSHLNSNSGSTPTLTVPNFFLWNFLKSKVYANKPTRIRQLKENIRQKINITVDTFRNDMQNPPQRARFYVTNRSGHLAIYRFPCLTSVINIHKKIDTFITGRLHSLTMFRKTATLHSDNAIPVVAL